MWPEYTDYTLFFIIVLPLLTIVNKFFKDFRTKLEPNWKTILIELYSSASAYGKSKNESIRTSSSTSSSSLAFVLVAPVSFSNS